MQLFTFEQNKKTSCELCRGGHKLKSCEKFKKIKYKRKQAFPNKDVYAKVSRSYNVFLVGFRTK